MSCCLDEEQLTVKTRPDAPLYTRVLSNNNHKFKENQMTESLSGLKYKEEFILPFWMFAGRSV